MVDHCLQLHCKMCEITGLVTVANCGRIRGAEKGKSALTMSVETFDLENHENVEKVKLKPISFFGGIGCGKSFRSHPHVKRGTSKRYIYIE